MHNECTRRRVLASRPDTMIEPRAASPRAGRSTGGLGCYDALAARHCTGRPRGGFVRLHHAPQAARSQSAAFAELRRDQPDAVYLLAGEVSAHYDLEALLSQGLGESVIVTGRLALSELLGAMAACDVAVNLRYPSGGETSGTLMRLLGMGKAVIVSDHGSFAELPDGCSAKVGVDESELAVLTTYLEALAGNRELRQRMGDNARRLMLTEHTLAGSAAAYTAFLERVVDVGRAPFRAAPPLIAESGSVYGELMATVGAAVADMGVADDDLELLGELAATVEDLGLGRGGESDAAG